MQQRNLGAEVLQVFFSFFLGLIVVFFVGIAVNTIYPDPERGDSVRGWADWHLWTGIWLLVCATLVMVVGVVVGSDRIPVIGNGVLLGGLFTMIDAIGAVWSAPNDWRRLGMIAAALLVTLGIGYWKFARRRAVPATVESTAMFPTATDPALSARLDAVERTLDGLRRALGD